ncbi:MAG: sugar ABC transporter permease [Thermoplasmata archaeon]|uniref:Sugar ABC transporter permease n=1 Tax=Candidatus Sysuiplasma superficiale TaxID=2823368 RepID=A0A8J8CBX8_9ARCH|nr:sugar ABC transporter permease [Candidatus Sysuiplasma superficiale]MBX8644000.1 sugar ABC transporter permease [Candidatus Sysuiplasma superficiale]
MFKNKSILFFVPTGIFSVVLLYLVGWNIYTSLTNSSSFHPVANFVGLGTYVTVFHDAIFVSSLEHSLLWAFALIAAGNALGIFFATLIYNVGSARIRLIFTTIFIYPLAISLAASAVIWTWLFNTNTGINTILRSFGIPGYTWLDRPGSALPSLILVSIWVFSGLAMIFYLASFQNVSREVIESAKIDGASTFRVLIKILLPESKNAFIVSTALLFLFALRIFSLPFVSTGLNPFTETSVLNMYFYYITEYFAKSSAVSVVLVILATVVVVPYALFGLKRWISHD